MIAQMGRLLAEYLGTFVSLARTEAGHDLAHFTHALVRWALAALAAVLGLVWLNIALLLWLLQSPWRIGGALAIGVVALVAAWGLTRTRLMGPAGPLPHTRELVRAELHAMGLGTHLHHEAPEGHAEDSAAAHVVSAQPMTPAIARAKVRLTRNRIGQLLAPPEPTPGQPLPATPGQPRPAASVGFVPKSRTMRLLMEYWGGRPDHGVIGTVLSSLVGFIALRNRKLRRAAMLIGTARSFIRMLGRRLRRG